MTTSSSFDPAAQLAAAVQQVRGEAVPALEQAGERASALAQQGADVLLDSARQLRRQARQLSRRTLTRIEDEPVKAMLVAAATGAVLAGLLCLLTRSRHPD